MFRAGDYIGVGLSGGKDSAALLYSLKKIYPGKHYIAIHLDHGIGEYSRDSRRKAEALAELLNIEIHIFDYKKELGIVIPDFKKSKYGRKICSTCGIIRRWALSKAAKEIGVDILATGHNLDDILEIMLTNFISGDFRSLTEIKPVLQPKHPSQVWKVKPLIKSPEYDNLLYAGFNNLPIKGIECPYHETARSIRRKNILRYWEERERNIKFQLYSIFTKKLSPILEDYYRKDEYKLNTCKVCGGPSIGEICGACKRIYEIKKIKYKRGN